eukprot:gene5276-18513_t
MHGSSTKPAPEEGYSSTSAPVNVSPIRPHPPAQQQPDGGGYARRSPSVPSSPQARSSGDLFSSPKASSAQPPAVQEGLGLLAQPPPVQGGLGLYEQPPAVQGSLVQSAQPPAVQEGLGLSAQPLAVQGGLGLSARPSAVQRSLGLSAQPLAGSQGGSPRGPGTNCSLGGWGQSPMDALPTDPTCLLSISRGSSASSLGGLGQSPIYALPPNPTSLLSISGGSSTSSLGGLGRSPMDALPPERTSLLSISGGSSTLSLGGLGRSPMDALPPERTCLLSISCGTSSSSLGGIGQILKDALPPDPKCLLSMYGGTSTSSLGGLGQSLMDALPPERTCLLSIYGGISRSSAGVVEEELVVPEASFSQHRDSTGGSTGEAPPAQSFLRFSRDGGMSSPVLTGGSRFPKAEGGRRRNTLDAVQMGGSRSPIPRGSLSPKAEGGRLSITLGNSTSISLCPHQDPAKPPLAGGGGPSPGPHVEHPPKGGLSICPKGQELLELVDLSGRLLRNPQAASGEFCGGPASTPSLATRKKSVSAARGPNSSTELPLFRSSAWGSVKEKGSCGRNLGLKYLTSQQQDLQKSSSMIFPTSQNQGNLPKQSSLPNGISSALGGASSLLAQHLGLAPLRTVNPDPEGLPSGSQRNLLPQLSTAYYSAASPKPSQAGYAMSAAAGPMSTAYYSAASPKPSQAGYAMSAAAGLGSDPGSSKGGGPASSKFAQYMSQQSLSKESSKANQGCVAIGGPGGPGGAAQGTLKIGLLIPPSCLFTESTIPPPIVDKLTGRVMHSVPSNSSMSTHTRSQRQQLVPLVLQAGQSPNQDSPYYMFSVKPETDPGAPEGANPQGGAHTGAVQQDGTTWAVQHESTPLDPAGRLLGEGYRHMAGNEDTTPGIASGSNGDGGTLGTSADHAGNSPPSPSPLLSPQKSRTQASKVQQESDTGWFDEDWGPWDSDERPVSTLGGVEAW